MKLFLQASFALLLSMSFFNHGHAESIKFISTPTHSKEVSTAIYTPLTEYLSQQTGKKVELIHPMNFLNYINRMKKGEYDITFDGPHFTSWRIKHLQDTAIARLPGTIKIAVITKQEYTNINTLDDLVGRKVCAFASPNLLTMAYLDHYPNPARLPMITSARGTNGFKGLIQCLKRNHAKAAVLRASVWKKIDKTGLKLISEKEKAFPARTFTASSRLDSATQDSIQQALLAPEATQHIQMLLKTFKKTKIISAKSEDYSDIDQLLKPLWSFR